MRDYAGLEPPSSAPVPAGCAYRAGNGGGPGERVSPNTLDRKAVQLENVARLEPESS